MDVGHIKGMVEVASKVGHWTVDEAGQSGSLWSCELRQRHVGLYLPNRNQSRVKDDSFIFLV